MTHDSGSETIEGVLGSDRNVQITAGGIRSSGLRSSVVGAAAAIAANHADLQGGESAIYLAPGDLGRFREAQATGAIARTGGRWVATFGETPGEGGEYGAGFEAGRSAALAELPEELRGRVIAPEAERAANTALQRLVEVADSLIVPTASADDRATTGARGEAAARSLLRSAGFENVEAFQNGSGNGFDIVAEYRGVRVFVEVKSSGNSTYNSLSELQRNFGETIERVLRQGQGARYSEAQRQRARELQRELEEGRVARGLYIGVRQVGRGRGRPAEFSVERWTDRGREPVVGSDGLPILRGTSGQVSRALRAHLRAARRGRR